MMLKTAARGRNRGSQFWSCSRYPDCKRIVNLDGDPPGPAAHSGAPATTIKRRVVWADATTNRRGWTCRYTTAGASLRSVDASRESAAALSLCWIARTESFADVDPNVERVVGLMRKILQRGTCPPIDPRSEIRLLESAGLASEVEPSAIPGDLSVRLKRRLNPDDLKAAIALPGGPADLDPELSFGSDEERQLIDWAAAELDDSAPRWFVPQAPLDSMLSAAGLPALGVRRVDFLVSAPWLKPFVVEVDGDQHGNSERVDDDRDDALGIAGYKVVRVRADELRVGLGLGLDELAGAWSEHPPATGKTFQRLVWGPVQLHRLVLGLLDALHVGFATGEKWVVEVNDPLDIAVDLVGPSLDLLLAVDRLWGGDIVPTEIVLGEGSRWQVFKREGLGFQCTETSDRPDHVDVQIRLEPERTGVERLPSASALPQIVIRSAFLPVRVSDPVYEGAGRVAVRTEGEEIEWAVRTMLRSIFAKEDFREGQLDALFEVIEGRDCAVLLPTGAGKSLIYQLAGLVLPGRTLVVDPLVALMEDQVEGLRSHGIDRVAAITSFTTMKGQTDALLEQVSSGEALFVFVAPERLQMQKFRDSLRQVTQTSPINLAVVDEAHCVSEWGHDFRTSYLNLGRTIREVCRDQLGNPPPILALTGTASRAVLRDVLVELGIERDSERAVVRPQTFDREELHFSIIRVEPRDSDAELAGFLRSLPQRFGVPPSDFFSPREERTFAGIVFVPHTNGNFGVVNVRQNLAPVVGSAPAIYAGGSPRGFENGWETTKRMMATAFKNDETPLLVSTKAFGMGIDKPNIRYVIHYGIPGSIEAYYQEVGRAGRDRRRAECGLVLVEYDEARARRLLSEDVDLEEARSEHDQGTRVENDDITRQLYFHFKSFRGIDSELDALQRVVRELGESGRRRSIEIPMGDDDDDKSERERALHRLVVLGIVRDYLVEWGARKFPVELATIRSADVVDNLIGYVRRNQPGRVEAIRAVAMPAATKPLEDAVTDCARILIEFVYDTVERSRRRSLREMWLAARETQHSPDVEFRQRILDYLSQGAIAPTLERLVDQPRFNYSDWITELEQIGDPDDAREMRGDSARLLSSYPDHPGLLFTRALSEVLDDRGDLREFISNIESSLRSATERYGTTPDELDRFAAWLLSYCSEQRSGSLAAAMAAIERSGLAAERVADWQRKSLVEPGSDVAVRVFALATSLDRAAADLKTITDNYEGVRT